jgi:hypothetical protein
MHNISHNQEINYSTVCLVILVFLLINFHYVDAFEKSKTPISRIETLKNRSIKEVIEFIKWHNREASKIRYKSTKRCGISK